MVCVKDTLQSEQEGSQWHSYSGDFGEKQEQTYKPDLREGRKSILAGPEWLRAMHSSTERLLRLLKSEAWIKHPVMQGHSALRRDSPANPFHCCSTFL